MDTAAVAVSIATGLIAIGVAVWRGGRAVVAAVSHPMDEMRIALDEHMVAEEKIRAAEAADVRRIRDDLHAMWTANHEAHISLVEAITAGLPEPYYMTRTDAAGPQMYQWCWGNSAYHEFMDVTPIEARSHEYWHRLPESDRLHMQETVTAAVTAGVSWEGTFDLVDRDGHMLGEAHASQVPLAGPDGETYFIGTVRLVD